MDFLLYYSNDPIWLASLKNGAWGALSGIGGLAVPLIELSIFFLFINRGLWKVKKYNRDFIRQYAKDNDGIYEYKEPPYKQILKDVVPSSFLNFMAIGFLVGLLCTYTKMGLTAAGCSNEKIVDLLTIFVMGATIGVYANTVMNRSKVKQFFNFIRRKLRLPIRTGMRIRRRRTNDK